MRRTLVMTLSLLGGVACKAPSSQLEVRITVPRDVIEAHVPGPSRITAEADFSPLFEGWLCPGDDEVVFEGSTILTGCRVPDNTVDVTLYEIEQSEAVDTAADDVPERCADAVRATAGGSLYAHIPVVPEVPEHPCSGKTVPTVEVDVRLTPEMFGPVQFPDED